MSLDDTELGLPLPHPDNDPRNVDVPRIRQALTMVDGFLKALIDGLSNVDNTSDADKPVSTATQAALAAKAASNHSHTAATTNAAGFMSAADKTKLDAVGTMANRAFTVSTADPSGGADGDIWFKVS
jgi:hypothetical protein